MEKQTGSNIYIMLRLLLFIAQMHCQDMFCPSNKGCNVLRYMEMRIYDKLVQFETKLNEIASRPGSTYVRWGKDSCPTTATTVYTGYTAGKHRNQTGSGTNPLCLHNSPKWGRYKVGTQGGRGFLYGGEYEPDDGSRSNLVYGLLPNSANDQIAPCTVCRTKLQREILMIPGTTNCESGWTREYDGYILTTRREDIGASEYICVDRTADVIFGGQNSNQFLMYPTEVKCGSLLCPPYVDGREVTCVVCSG